MSPETIKLFNQFGIILNFLSFFLVAPEIIGAERLKLWVSHAAGNLAAYILGVFLAGIALFLTAIALLALYWNRSPVIEVVPPHMALVASLLISLYLFAVFFFSKHDRWTKRIVKYFSDDAIARRRIFQAGVAMFVVGNVLQFIAASWQ